MIPFLQSLLAAAALFVMSQSGAAASPPSKEEIAATAAWFDSLKWPDLRGKPYVEIRFGQSMIGSKMEDGPKVRGFCLAEDAQSITVFSDGTVSSRRSSPYRLGWPCSPMQIQKSPRDENAFSRLAVRTIELPQAVQELLDELHRPKDHDEEVRASFGRMISDRTAVFLFARGCARQGRADLAAQLDAELMALLARARTSSSSVEPSFRDATEQEIANVLMWKAVVDCGDAGVTRPALLAEFDRVARDFPGCKHHDRAIGFVALLGQMITEDEAHARAVKPMEAMNQDELVHELIFRLRDQNGNQSSQPGSCDVFGDHWMRHGEGTSPAHQLVKLGHAAVPALIEALSDRRLSHSVGYQRDFYFSHFVLSVGDCAEAVLSRIAGRSFWVAQSTSAAMQKDGQLDETRAAVEAWWHDLQDHGEEATLIAGVRSGGRDSPKQAARLAALEPPAALDAIAVGLRSAKSNWIRTQLVNAIAAIQGEEATTALQRETKECASLHGRAAAAAELFWRGDSEQAVSIMIGEWNRWIPSPRGGWDEAHEDAGPLIAFLSTCGDLRAVKALADRFPSLRVDVKLKILEAVVGNMALFTHGRRWEKIPLSPAIEALDQDLAIAALDDRSVRYGMTSSDGKITYRNPRVCDYTASMLSLRWPQRYEFQWLPTRIERDVEIAQIRNVWRSAQGLAPTLPPALPAEDSPPLPPNAIRSLKWSGGAALPGFPLIEGQPLTADSVVETLVLLHRDLPSGLVGFELIAERPTGQPGFVVEIEWSSLPDANTGSSTGGSGWRCHTDIALGSDSLYSGSGGASLGRRFEASAYDSEKRAIAKALAADPAQAISIDFYSHRSQE